MRILETLECLNAEKTILGKRHFELTFDTETSELAINGPAMMTDPIVDPHELKKKLDKLLANEERRDAGDA